MNDDPHSQMAYQSEESLKQDYEHGQAQAQGQGNGEKAEYPPPAYQMAAAPASPPTSASPFAFAPPPLSSMPGPGSSSRPSLTHSHHYSDGPYPKAHQSQQQPYPGGHPLPTYRRPGVPGASPAPPMAGSQQSTSPRQAARQTSLNSNVSNSSNPNLVPSPSGSSPYPSHYFPPQNQRQVSGGPHGSQYQSSPTLAHMGPPTGSYGQVYSRPMYSPQEYSYAPSPSYMNHPGLPHSRSDPYAYLGSPSSYGTQPGSTQASHMLPSISAPSHIGGHSYNGHLPPLARHQSSSSMLPEAMSSVDLGSPGVTGRPPLLQTTSGPAQPGGYSFANRLPLVDRPFKCDECVQSFNRNHDLKRHKRIHLSVKPFGCEKCGKTFSRKDALRRHWLVKGCRGEDGATAKISPTFPLNDAPPALTPPTPTDIYAAYPLGRPQPSFAHPGAPPPLPTLPPRQPSDQSTAILTPDDPIGHDGQPLQPLHEPILLNSRSNSDMSGSAPGEGDDGYFDSAAVSKEGMRGAFYSSSPSQKMANRNHPYSRSPRPDPRYVAPSPSQSSPNSGGRYLGQTLQQQQQQAPVFAMPFAPQAGHYMQENLMVPTGQGEDMARQTSGSSSQGDDPAVWQRWHRPSFPFPPPPNGNYNEAPRDFAEPTVA